MQNAHVLGITARTAAAYARAGWTTVLEGIVGPWFLPVVAEAAADLDVHYAVLRLGLDDCRTRVAGRGGNVAPDVVAKMHHEFEHHDVDPRHRVDSTGDPTVVADRLFTAMAAGHLCLP